MNPAPEAGTWTFLSNHAHVLMCVGQQPDVRMRDIAERVGITERAVQRIVAELVEAKILRRVRNGRRNQYEVDRDQPLRHPVEADCTVGVLLEALAKRKRVRPATKQRKK